LTNIPNCGTIHLGLIFLDDDDDDDGDGSTGIGVCLSFAYLVFDLVDSPCFIFSFFYSYIL